MVQLATSILLDICRRVKRGGVIVNEHTLTAAQTRRHIEILGRWFQFIDLDELPHRMSHPGRRPFCLLTFDDGKRSNYTEVAPELERQGVPAVFYVTTDFLTNGRPLWFDRHQGLIRTLGYCPAGLELNTLKQLANAELMSRLENAYARHRVDGTSLSSSEHVRPMSWDEARDLKHRGFTIGAHGVTHAILTNEPPARAVTEIEESLRRVTSEMRAPCTTFAFPNGNHSTELLRHVRRCGASAVMITEPRWVDAHDSCQSLPRIQLFGEFSRARIELKIALAALPGALTNPDGTGRSYGIGKRHKCNADPATLSSCVE